MAYMASFKPAPTHEPTTDSLLKYSTTNDTMVMPVHSTMARVEPNLSLVAPARGLKTMSQRLAEDTISPPTTAPSPTTSA